MDGRFHNLGFCGSPRSKGVKRKWSVVDMPENQLLKSPLNLDSSSSKDREEESSSMDLELDFTLHLGSDKPSVLDNDKLESQKVNLQLSEPSTSDITFLHPQVNLADKGSGVGKTTPKSSKHGGRQHKHKKGGQGSRMFCRQHKWEGCGQGRMDFCISHGGDERVHGGKTEFGSVGLGKEVPEGRVHGGNLMTMIGAHKSWL